MYIIITGLYYFAFLIIILKDKEKQIQQANSRSALEKIVDTQGQQHKFEYTCDNMEKPTFLIDPTSVDELCSLLNMISEGSQQNLNKLLGVLDDAMINKTTTMFKAIQLIFCLPTTKMSQSKYTINWDTKQMLASYIQNFIQTNLIPRNQQHKSQKISLAHQKLPTIQLNSCINSLQRILSKTEQNDSQSYTNTIVRTYIRLVLYINQYSPQSIRKLVNICKFYFGKRRSYIGVSLLDKLMNSKIKNFIRVHMAQKLNNNTLKFGNINKKRHKKSNKHSSGLLDRVKQPELKKQLIQLLVQDISFHSKNISKQSKIISQCQSCQLQIQIAQTQKKLGNSMTTLCQIISGSSVEHAQLQIVKYIVNLCNNTKLVDALISCWNSYSSEVLQTWAQQCIENNQDKHKQKVVNCVLMIVSQLAKYLVYQLNPNCLELYKLLMQVSNKIWSIYIEQFASSLIIDYLFISQIQKCRKDPLSYSKQAVKPLLMMNTASKNTLLTFLDIGNGFSITQDGIKTIQFKADHHYVIHNFVMPISYAFKHMFLNMLVSKDGDLSESFIRMIKNLAFLGDAGNITQDCWQQEDILGGIQVAQQPILHSLCIIVLKLVQVFSSIESILKKLVYTFLMEQIRENSNKRQKGKQPQWYQQYYTFFQNMKVPIDENFGNNNVIIGLIMSIVFRGVLAKYEDWLTFIKAAMGEFTYMLFLGQHEQAPNVNGSLLRFVYLLNYRIYMDDIYQGQLHNKQAHQIILHLIDNITGTSKNTSMDHGSLSIDIIQNYYKQTLKHRMLANRLHDHGQASKQRENILRIVECRVGRNRAIIQLQVALIEQYHHLIGLQSLYSYVEWVTSELRCQSGVDMFLCRQILLRIGKVMQEYYLGVIKYYGQYLDNLLQHYNANCYQLIVQLLHSLMGNSEQINYMRSKSIDMIHSVIAEYRICLQYTRQSIQSMIACIHTHAQKLKLQQHTKYSPLSTQNYQRYQALFQQHSKTYMNTQQKIQQLAIKTIACIQHQEYIFPDNSIQEKQRINLVYQFIDIICQSHDSGLILSVLQTCLRILSKPIRTCIYTQVKLILATQQIIHQHSQLLTQQHISSLLQIMEIWSNNQDATLPTDKEYLIRGKIYITIILLLVYLVRDITECIDDVQQNNLYNRQDQGKIYDRKLMCLFKEVFCPANYLPFYDVPLVIVLMEEILKKLVYKQRSRKEEDRQQLFMHAKFMHMYLKLLLQSAQRLHILCIQSPKLLLQQSIGKQDQKYDEWASDIQSEQQIPEHSIHRDYKNIGLLIEQSSNLELYGKIRNKNSEQILSQFVEAYSDLLKQKSKWVADVESKFVSPKTTQNIKRICNQYGHQSKLVKNKGDQHMNIKSSNTGVKHRKLYRVFKQDKQF